jgi:hypothetical protein
MLAARYDKVTGACQSLEAHASQVAARCAAAYEPLGLQKLGCLADLMAAAMSGHHRGLPDCLTPGGADGLHQRFYSKRDAGSEAAVAPHTGGVD